MEQLKGLFRGFDFVEDNPLLLFLIIGLVIFLIMGNGDIGCFLEQNNSLIWIVLIVLVIFALNNNDCYEDDCCC